ncbi:MAG: hypothetical protein Q8O35_00290 [Humidesulfovibrio sp.]|jgi:uncharacterized protein (UPF0332 family)|uniref:hypothetical protein n=1 Tax=Humidesulfovibrio sp. TaxID=2910988 RepID=UPI002735612C|nr:hypothetical protein [Humidesulfovibrio sp.]MDP2846608.1 hypothetical protein [Humidesulfovibrio sp.]
MTDFDKQKIAFTVALLAVLLSFHPILSHIGESGFIFFQWFLSVSQLYYCVSGLFAISVYAFGFRLLTDKGARFISVVGNSFYGAAIVLPILYVVLFFASFALNLYIDNVRTINTVLAILNVIVGASSFYVVYYMQGRIGSREAQSTIEKYSKDEVLFVERAHKLLGTGYYDLAVVEAFKAVEVSALRFMLSKGISTSQGRWFSNSAISEVLTPELMQGLQQMREARNKAAHGTDPISEAFAKKVIPLATSIVARFSAQEDSDGS